jgi:GAF domain-containing protein
MTGTVLCVDSDEEARTATAAALRGDAGVDVRECGTTAAALDVIEAGVDCVVTEYDLPDGTGMDLLERLRETAPDTAFVLFTDAAPDAIDTAALEDAVVEYVPKGGPWARDDLVDLVAHTVSSRSQTAYPLPDDEAERVAALERYAPDTVELQESFDRLTAIACGLLDVPMAGIGLVDSHEEEFVSCQGVGLGILPREDTVCTYALLEEDVTTIPDVADDPRFAGNEGLEELGIRAYAGGNIRVEGRTIGMFCVFDDEPRTWTDADREHLRLLAAEAAEQIELRERVRSGGNDDGPADPTAAAAGGEDR